MNAHRAQLSFSVENLLGLGNKERRPNHSLHQEHALPEFFEEEKLGHHDRRKEDSYQKRRRRVLFSESQVDILKNVFAKQKYLTAECRKRLAESLNLSPKQVKTWFQNYRYKCRRKGFSSKGCPQAELEQEMPNHVGTATMVARTWTNMSPPDIATVFCRNFHPSWEYTASMAPLNTLYHGNQERSLANFSYRFPSKYQHLQAYQMYAN